MGKKASLIQLLIFCLFIGGFFRGQSAAAGPGILRGGEQISHADA
jgi:hypothetical protein